MWEATQGMCHGPAVTTTRRLYNMIDNRLDNYLEAKVAKNKEIGRKNWKFYHWLQIINFQESISNQGIY